MKLKLFLFLTIFAARTINANQPITETANLSDSYIEFIEAELRGVFPGYQKPVSFRKPGTVQKFLDEQIPKFYIPRPWYVAPKKLRKQKKKIAPKQWKSPNEYIAEVLIPDLKAVFGDKNMKKRVRFFRDTEHVGKYIRALLNRFYVRKRGVWPEALPDGI